MFVVGLKSGIDQTYEMFGIFNLMTIFFVQYILFFIFGTLAYRNDWVRRFNGKDKRFWTWLTVGMFLMMPVLFVVGGAMEYGPDVFTGGLHWQSAAFMLWIGIFSVSISMAMMLGLRDRQKPRSGLMKFGGPNSYGVYLIHPLILVPLSVAVRNVTLHPLLKFAIVLPIVVVLCFLVADALRRIPGVKSVL
jgi:surface polysaccharide O-acyltransferase-like enzyme